MWYSHTLEYYLAIKRNKLIMIKATTWMNLKNIMLHKRNQLERPHILWFHLHKTSRKGKTITCQVYWWLPKAEREGWWWVTKIDSTDLLGVMEIFWNCIVVMVAQLCGSNLKKPFSWIFRIAGFYAVNI